jgi:hypothetical protein
MRKRKDFKRIEGVKSSRLIVIAAEGRATENIYFEAMRQEFCASNVQLVVLNREDDNSSPANVHRQLKAFLDEYNIQDDDQLWVVIDRDDWKEKMLAEVAQLCQQNDNLRFCMSNPCFELWLILHLEDVAAYSDEEKLSLLENSRLSTHGTWTKYRLRQLMCQYQEADYNPYQLLPHISIAIGRAELLDTNPKDRWPQGIGTRVYLLAKSIMNKK